MDRRAAVLNLVALAAATVVAAAIAAALPGCAALSRPDPIFAYPPTRSEQPPRARAAEAIRIEGAIVDADRELASSLVGLRWVSAQDPRCVAGVLDPIATSRFLALSQDHIRPLPFLETLPEKEATFESITRRAYIADYVVVGESVLDPVVSCYETGVSVRVTPIFDARALRLVVDLEATWEPTDGPKQVEIETWFGPTITIEVPELTAIHLATPLDLGPHECGVIAIDRGAELGPLILLLAAEPLVAPL